MDEVVDQASFSRSSATEPCSQRSLECGRQRVNLTNHKLGTAELDDDRGHLGLPQNAERHPANAVVGEPESRGELFLNELCELATGGGLVAEAAIVRGRALGASGEKVESDIAGSVRTVSRGGPA